MVCGRLKECVSDCALHFYHNQKRGTENVCIHMEYPTRYSHSFASKLAGLTLWLHIMI